MPCRYTICQPSFENSVNLERQALVHSNHKNTNQFISISYRIEHLPEKPCALQVLASQPFLLHSWHFPEPACSSKRIAGKCPPHAEHREGR